jgi:hypothetical protein
MNKLTKAIILGSVALATITSTVETASAGDRMWRNRGFHDRGWHGHRGPGAGRWVAAGVLGLAAGVIVNEALSEPRVVYRERPVYVDPDNGPDEYLGPVDGVMDPDDGDYVLPRNQHRVERSNRDEQYQGDPDQMDQQAQDENYFPDRPQKQRNARNQDVAQQGTLEPWTAKWRTYCKQRYSSFNATTGTYQGYDGKSHFCTSG